MQNIPKNTAVILMLGMLVFPAFSQGSMDGSGQNTMGGPGAGGNQSSQQRPERQELPTPSEAELSLLRLNSLIDGTLSDPSLTITTAQAEALIPILEEWKMAVDSNPQANTEKYIDGITAILTDAQNLFLPVPPNGREGGPNNMQGSEASGNGPSGEMASGEGPSGEMPEPMEISSILLELIEALTLL